MNAFTRHGVAHLSPSSLNLFASQPAMWCMEKLLKRRGPVGCAAHRGSAAEAGIVYGLLNPNAEIAYCQAVAMAEYNRLTAMSGDPRREKERDAVPAIVASAVPELRKYGIPDGTQVKVQKMIEGIPVPFLGFIDVRWSQHGMLLDIKTQLRLSSAISDGHGRQVAIYAHGTNDTAGIAYCTPQKIGIYKLENAAEHIAAVVAIAKRMEAFLSLSDDPAVLCSAVCPDWDSFYWSDPTTRAMGREVFGF